MVIAVAPLLISACSANDPGLGLSPEVSYDGPALRALKAAAHIATCPAPTAPPTGELPKATLPCLGGGPSVALARLRGPLVINLWEAGCAPCRTEAPFLEAFARKFRGRVAVLGVDYQDWEPSVGIATARAWGLTYPMVADLNSAIRTVSTPTTILVDAHGRITFQRPIPLTSETELESLVREHLGVSLPS